jgi:hypothetical protein
LDRASSLNSLENSNIECLWALNQRLTKILVVLVVAVPYVWFTTPMTFCVLFTLINTVREGQFRLTCAEIEFPH